MPAHRRYAIADEAMLREAAAKLAALHDAQREAFRRVYFAGRLASSDKVLTKSEGAETAALKLRAPQLVGKLRKEMVGRDGIEPPTPGFSGLTPIGRIARILDDLLPRRGTVDVARSAGLLWSIARRE